MKKLIKIAFILFVSTTLTLSINSMNANEQKNEEAKIQNEKQKLEQDVLLDIASQFAFEFYKEHGYTPTNIKSIMGRGSNWTLEFENNVAINVIMEIDKSSGEILQVNVKEV